MMPAARADSDLNTALQERRVFISYSRKDVEFVRRLHDELLACDRHAWVDWEGIPPTADWMQEIGAAINEAEAFAFVVSPDSIASPVCLRELAHAAAQNKRLIPIVWREVDAAKVPEALGKLNWIFFRATDDFPAALHTLLGAVDTDLDWVHAHTRLLVRAHEWEARKQNSSFAVRGDDLKAAEQWLTLGPTKEPKPTELQTRYIIESRRVATKRRFALLGGAVVALMVIAVLGTVAFFIQREANRQQTIAVARRLTSAAELQREQEPVEPVDMGPVESSMLLATEAMRRLASVGFRSLETDIAMRRGLAVHPRRLPLETREDIFFFEQIAFGLDGSLVAAMKDPVARGVWDLESFKLRAFAASQSDAQEVALSPDGRFLAVLGYNHLDGAVDIFDLKSPEPFARPFASLAAVRGGSYVALAPNAAYLAVAGSDYDQKAGWGPGWTRIWQMSGRTRELPRLPSVSSPSFSPDGVYLAGVVDGRAAVWTLERLGEVVDAAPTLSIGSGAAYVLFSPDGKYLALQPQQDTGAVQIWSINDWTLLRQVKRDGLLAVSPQGRYVAVRRGEGLSVEVIDTVTGKTAALINSRWAGTPVVFGADGQNVAIGANPGAGSVPDLWRISDHGSDSARVQAGPQAYAIAFSADETRLTTFSRTEEASGSKLAAQLKEITGSGRDSQLDLGLAPTALTISADGQFLAVGSTGEARVLAAGTGKTRPELYLRGHGTSLGVESERCVRRRGHRCGGAAPLAGHAARGPRIFEAEDRSHGHQLRREDRRGGIQPRREPKREPVGSECLEPSGHDGRPRGARWG